MKNEMKFLKIKIKLKSFCKIIPYVFISFVFMVQVADQCTSGRVDLHKLLVKTD